MKNKTFLLGFLAVGVTYWLTHLWGLLSLPVFADEAIYIRWAQLIIDDWRQYLFFPLNDGKTPLFMWLLVPFQFIFSNQLYAARFVSVSIGFFQVLAVGILLRKLNASRGASLFGALLVTILPFWFFHHRMALTESLLGLTLTISLIGVVQTVMADPSERDTYLSSSEAKGLLLLVLGFFSALLTKIPAVLVIPALFIPVFYLVNPEKNTKKLIIRKAIIIALGIIGSFLFFATQSIHPAFSQLFSRGGDFLYSSAEVINGRFFDNVLRVPRYFSFFYWYLSVPVLILLLIGLFTKSVQKSVHIFFWSGVLYCLPIIIMGKVVHPRYFFPAVLFFTVAAAFSFQGIIAQLEAVRVRFMVKFSLVLLFAVLLSSIAIHSLSFILPSATSPGEIPFVTEDAYQYLEGWSAGYGTAELVAVLKEKTKNTRVAVATEGSFGSLPDGILLYQHGLDVKNVYVEGVGFPSTQFPDFFVERAKDFDEVWYVANEDRVSLFVAEFPELYRFCRPHAAPCLVVWNVTDQITP